MNEVKWAFSREKHQTPGNLIPIYCVMVSMQKDRYGKGDILSYKRFRTTPHKTTLKMRVKCALTLTNFAKVHSYIKKILIKGFF